MAIEDYLERRTIAPTSSVRQVLTYSPSMGQSSVPPIQTNNAAGPSAGGDPLFPNVRNAASNVLGGVPTYQGDNLGAAPPTTSALDAGRQGGLSFPFSDGTYYGGPLSVSTGNGNSPSDSWNNLYDEGWQNVLGEYTNLLAEQADELEGYDRQLEDINREMRQATEQHGLALEGINVARRQLAERRDLSMDEIAQLRAELDEQERVVNENYDLAMAQAEVKQRTLDAALEAVGYAKANGVSNEEAIQAVYGKLKAEHSALWAAAAGTPVDSQGMNVIATEAESRVLDEFANSTDAVASVMGSELSAAAMEAISGIAGAQQEEVLGVMQAIANAEITELTGIGNMMSTAAERAGALSDLGFTGQELLSEGQFRNQQIGFDQQIQDIGFQQEFLNLDIEGLNLQKDQAERSLDLARKEADLRERGVNLNYDQAMEDLWLSEKAENLGYSHVLEDMLDMQVRTYEDLVKAAEAMRADPEGYRNDFALGVHNEVFGAKLDEMGIDGFQKDAIMEFVQGAIESGAVATAADMQAHLALYLEDNPTLKDIFGTFGVELGVDPKYGQPMLLNPQNPLASTVIGSITYFDKALRDADDMMDRVRAAQELMYEGSPVGMNRGSSAPSNYANRNSPLYKARAQLAASVATNIRSIFPEITKVGGVNYYRPPTDVGNGRAANSDHQSAGAIDVYADPATMKRIEAWAKTQPYVSYVVYSGDKHHEGHHVHISFMLGYGADAMHSAASAGTSTGGSIGSTSTSGGSSGGSPTPTPSGSTRPVE